MESKQVAIQDKRVQGRHGRLFVRSWTPRDARCLAPLILLHDSLGSVELWRRFPAALCEATGRAVVAYDRLGFGQSDPHPDALAPDFVAAEASGDFAAVREQLGIERFALLGHSVGGGMAVHCAVRHGAACVGLVTEAAQAFIEDRTVQGIAAAKELFRDPKEFDRLAKYHGEKTRWVLDAWIDTWLQPAFTNWSLRAVLPPVACPTLVIHGFDDEYGSTAQALTIAEGIGPHSRLEILPQTRHVPHREHPAQVVRLVRDFMAGLP
jgi:pimeloyl-ACP methyl ester carboxylesterase